MERVSNLCVGVQYDSVQGIIDEPYWKTDAKLTSASLGEQSSA